MDVVDVLGVAEGGEGASDSLDKEPDWIERGMLSSGLLGRPRLSKGACPISEHSPLRAGST